VQGATAIVRVRISHEATNMMGCRTKLQSRRGLWVALSISLLVMVVNQALIPQNTVGRHTLNEQREKKNSTACHIPPKAKRTNVTEPLYIASYPGSGSTLMNYVVEALTGIKTIEHGGNCGPPETPYDYMAIKTHYPFNCGGKWEDEGFSRAVVLIRNPMDALPSKASRQYESDENAKRHSAQAPEEYWTEWRDKNFATHLKLWEELIYYWFDNYDAANRIFIPYEQLVSKESGPAMTLELSRFLHKTGPSMLRREETDCVWDVVVAGERNNIHRKSEYQPNFSLEQYNAISEVLSRLTSKFESAESFGGIFQEFARALEERKYTTASNETSVH